MKPKITLEITLFLSVFLLAVAIRSFHLGDTPLSNFEAEWAVRSWEISQGRQVVLGPQPGYVLLTGLVFFLVKSSNFLARILPVLAGSIIAIIPFFFRSHLGRKAALVMAVVLALSPILVNVSRFVGGPMMALGFTLMAAATWIDRREISAGIFGGLALLSGPAVVAGVLGLLISWVAARSFGILPDGKEGEEKQGSKSLFGNSIRFNQIVNKSLIVGGGTLLLGGTLFLRFPEGLGATAAIIPAYIKGWFSSSGVPIFRMILALVSYQPLALIFGIVATARVWRKRGSDKKTITGRFLSLWLLFSLGLVLAYPSRQVADLVWVAVPLWGLASLEISQHLRWNGWGEIQTWTLAIFILVLLTSVWINLAGLVRLEIGTQVFNWRLMIILGALILVGLSTLLVALGWARESAIRGLVWGLTLGMTFYMVALSIRGNAVRSTVTSQNIWISEPGVGDIELLVKTMEDLGEWKTGREDGVDVVSLVEAPSLQWALRNFPEISFRGDMGFDSNPSLVITPQNQLDLRLASAYRGQDFVGWGFPAWESMTLNDWMRWFVFREVPSVPEYIILWGKVDVFPGGLSTLDVDEFSNMETDFPGSLEEISSDDSFRDGNIPIK